MIDLVADLSVPQREGVLHAEGPLLILAGAGSGKTRVITRRIVHLIRAHRVPPSAILAITFTNKAAREMLDRVRALEPHADVWISTFHAFCAAILRRHAELLEGRSRSFTIYDSAEQVQVMREVLSELQVDTSRYRPSAVLAKISGAKNRLEKPSDLAARGDDPTARVAARAYTRYLEKLVEANAVDFDDLLLLAIEILDRHEDVRRHYQERFRHLLVDEYQDTNRPQYLLARTLAADHGNLCATGDPDQAIYRWRGADLNNILDFERDFPGAQVIRLEENYRSTGNILRAASELIRHNRRRKEKTLFTRQGAGEPVRLLLCEDEADEAHAFVERIERAVRTGARLRDVAIFYRTNALSRPIEEALIRAAIPYVIVGAVEFFQRREVKDLVAYLRAVANPSDAWAIERAANVPRRGIGEKTLELLRSAAARHGIGLGAAMERAPEFLEGRSRAAVASFSTLLSRWRELPSRPIEAILAAILRAIDYIAYLKAQDLPDIDDRIDNVHALEGAAALYDERNPDGSLEGFLEEIALVSEVDDLDEDAERVTLMTLHAAKGLEFPIVMIAGLEERLLPHERCLGDEEEIEEERRLCHVGFTRAKNELWISRAERRSVFGAPMPQSPSRFLSEVPGDVLEVIDRRIGFDLDASRSRDDEDAPLEAHEAAAARLTFAEGELVRHPYFGMGRIVALSGLGGSQRATVRFNDGSERRLLLEYAQLSRIERTGRTS